MEKKLWQKNFSINQAVEQFTIGNDAEFDLLLARHDVNASRAHAKMLAKINLITSKELTQILSGLDNIQRLIKEGKFTIENGIEDVHSQIEFMLTQLAGEAGKKIHTARSRNDQVLTAIKLFLKEELEHIAEKTKQLQFTLREKEVLHRHVYLPGYTHFQIAMPSTFGYWFGAYADSLEEDLELVYAAHKICDKNPLGSAAGYGTNFPVDKKFTAEQLQFSGVNDNPVYAQMTRGKSEKQVAWALATIAATLSKYSYDACLYLCQNFSFISLPKELTTGSSIMPHKKNPDVFELVRGKCNILQGVPNQLTLLCSNLPHGYHRDFQLTKQLLFPAIKELKDCIEMLILMTSKMEVNEKILLDEKYRHIFSVEEVNRLVMQGISFREAYRMVADRIAADDQKENTSAQS